MFDTAVLGFVVAICVPVSALTAARLHKSGETGRVGKIFPLSLLVLTLGILQAISFAAALFYFSWAHLTWVQNLLAVLMFFTLAQLLAQSNNKGVVWFSFSVSTLVAFVAEALLIFG